MAVDATACETSSIHMTGRIGYRDWPVVGYRVRQQQLNPSGIIGPQLNIRVLLFDIFSVKLNRCCCLFFFFQWIEEFKGFIFSDDQRFFRLDLFR